VWRSNSEHQSDNQTRHTMAAVDPYSPCPCGSGEKFKWCCQKVEAYAERAQRLVENGQYETALKPLEEGLSKAPDSAWLLTRKALIHLHLRQLGAAQDALLALLQKQPKHLGASILMTRVALEAEGPLAGATRFQQALGAARTEDRKHLARLALFLGTSLRQVGCGAAALKHMELAQKLGGEDKEQETAAIRALRSNPSISAWEKNPYQLWPPPANVSEQFRVSFERALAWASDGLWSAAGAAFELLAAGSFAGAIANRNRGLCCLWLADHAAAAAAFRRYVHRVGPTMDAVEIEALCQTIEVAAPDEQIELLHLSWPIRNRDGLLAACRSDRSLEEGSQRPLDPGDPDSTQCLALFLLDRPMPTARPGLTQQEIPAIEGELLVGQDTVVLEAYDDDRLDRLIDRFTALAGFNIPPAHPRTKVIGHAQRHAVDVSRQWHLPPGLTPEDVERLQREQHREVIGEIWPKTPHPALGWRTPLQAALAGDCETALRAAVLSLEQANEQSDDSVDWKELRRKLHLQPEPAIELDKLNIQQLHLARLPCLPILELDDDRLLALYDRSREWGLRALTVRLANLVAERPFLLGKGGIETTTLYGDLALDAARRGDRAKALAWLEHGRNADPLRKRAERALAWDMTELQIQIALDEPEVWIPTVAGILQRYRGDRQATSAVFIGLINLGLVQLVPDQYHPDQLALDTRHLESLLSQYGPRVTTATGETAASAAHGGIWTPEASSAGGTIWTPDSPAPTGPSTDKPKIIVTGH
jgi:hypothetical protein